MSSSIPRGMDKKSFTRARAQSEVWVTAQLEIDHALWWNQFGTSVQ